MIVKAKSSLVLVGTGIKFLSHLTREAELYIRESDKVLYLVNDPAMKAWIHEANSNAESLDDLYIKFSLRKDNYKIITAYIIDLLKQDKDICVVFYGHPTVCADSGLEAIKQARALGYYAKVLPGISSEDCLFADLLIDPTNCGCQSYEATDFLLHNRKINTDCHVILWQTDVIGILTNPNQHDDKRGVDVLIEYLKEYYPSSHPVILYKAAQYPGFYPVINEVILEKLTDLEQTSTSSLYIPPLKQIDYDPLVLSKLNMKIIDLQ